MKTRSTYQYNFYAMAYRHMWRVPRGYTVIDVLLNRVLLLLAFSLPLEGILQAYFSGIGRSLSFYLSIFALGIAFWRLPQVLHNVRIARGLLLLVGVYIWTFVLYYWSPLWPNTTNRLLVQLILMSIAFLYVADIEEMRRRLIWAYWLGWLVLVFWSISNFLSGNYSLIDRGDIFRVVDISGYSANQHARQICAGIILTLTFVFKETKQETRIVEGAALLAAGFALLLTNSRGATLSLVLTIVLFITAQIGYSNVSRRFIRLSVVFTLLLIGFYYIFFETEVGQTSWNSYVSRTEELLEEPETDIRVELANASLGIFYLNPFGVGQGNSPFFLRERLGKAFDSHNYYLRILVEAGLLGSFVFAVALLLIIRTGWQWSKYSGDDSHFWPLIFFLIAAATGRDFHFKVFWFFLALNALTPMLVQKAQNRLTAPFTKVATS